MDDALDLRAGLGLDRNDVAAVAEGDDRVLEGVAELRADERLETSPEPVVGDPDGGPQPTEPRRCGVEQLTDRIEAASERRAERGQGMDLAGEGVQERPSVVGQARLEAGGRIERVGELEELGRIEAAAARRPLDRGADVVGRADTDPRPLAEQRPRLVRLVEGPSDDDRLGRRLEFIGEPAGRGEGCLLGEPLTDLRELEEEDRAGVHPGQRPRAGRVSLPVPDTDGWPAIANRHGTSVQGVPAKSIPRRGVATTIGRGSSSGASSSRRTPSGARRSRPVNDRSMPNAAATRPGPAARRAVGSRARRAASRARPPRSPRHRGRAPRESGRPHRRHALDRLDGADEERRRPADGLGDDVQAVVHPVDKVHVGNAGVPIHDRVAGGSPEAGVRRPVLLADVRLDLDDPASPGCPIGRLVDQVGTQEGVGDLERRPGEERGSVVQERVRKSAWRSPGMKSPNTFMKPGIRRVAEEVWPSPRCR